MESSEASALYAKIVDFMERDLGLAIPAFMRTVPVLAVDIHCLNQNAANATADTHQIKQQKQSNEKEKHFVIYLFIFSFNIIYILLLIINSN
jgi:hypothetical protein